MFSHKKPAKIQHFFYLRKCARNFLKKNTLIVKFSPLAFLLSPFFCTFAPNLGYYTQILKY